MAVGDWSGCADGAHSSSGERVGWALAVVGAAPPLRRIKRQKRVGGLGGGGRAGRLGAKSDGKHALLLILGVSM